MVAESWDELRIGRRMNKLTAEEAAEIRLLYTDDGLTQREIADIFDVNHSSIWDVIHHLAHKPHDPLLAHASPSRTMEPTCHTTPVIRGIVRPRDNENWVQWRIRVNDQMLALAEATAFGERP